MNFSSILVKWYDFNKRDLPWRKTNDPYKIWISEIILQQTRVDQGLSYYNQFVSCYPKIFDLANASEDEVLKLWQGLGYYSRARNLHFTAKFICDNYDGLFPQTHKEILMLKGIGLYTASAISSFAFNLQHAVVDGNVIRVLSRIYGIYTFYDSSIGKKYFLKLAKKKLPTKNSDTHNQAIMEFGALVCKPKKPNCLDCIFNQECYAFNNSKIHILPRKINKVKVVSRYLHFLIISHLDNVFLIKKKIGIWSGLYEFPFIEYSKMLDNDDVLLSEEWVSFFSKNKVTVNLVSPLIVHKLSHQKLHVKFWHLRCDSLKLTDYDSIKITNLHEFPVSRLMDIYLSDNNIC
jgi:A/G-specific adenine glycosylase